MNGSDYPDAAPGKPLWLVTLADLALLLIGFLVLMQATQQIGGKALAKGMREGFGASETEDAPIPLASAAMLDFAPGSAILPHAPAAVIAWAREALADPRVQLTVTGSTDGSAADIDRASGSASILAADRARALAAVLRSDRVVITTTPRPGRRAATLTLALVGEPLRTPK